MTYIVNQTKPLTPLNGDEMFEAEKFVLFPNDSEGPIFPRSYSMPAGSIYTKSNPQLVSHHLRSLDIGGAPIQPWKLLVAGQWFYVKNESIVSYQIKKKGDYVWTKFKVLNRTLPM